MKKTHERTFIVTFLIAPIVTYSLFYVYPFINAFRISFYRWSGLSPRMTFVGLANYRRLFTDSIFYQTLYNQIFLIIVTSLITFSLAMIFAVIFTSKSYPENSFLRVIFFFPNMLSMVVVSILWKFIYNPHFGLLNGFLSLIGLEGNTALLASSSTVLAALVAPQVWMLVGFYMVLFIASINTIPVELYESAKIDGAGMVRQFISITIPGIWYTIQITFVFFFIATVSNSFALVRVTTGGGPSRSSEVVTTYFYQQAFDNSNFGYALAIGFIVSLVMFVLASLIMKYTKRDLT